MSGRRFRGPPIKTKLERMVERHGWEPAFRFAWGETRLGIRLPAGNIYWRQVPYDEPLEPFVASTLRRARELAAVAASSGRI